MKLPWLFVAASSSFACGLVCIQFRNLVNHALAAAVSLPVHPGAPESNTVSASSTCLMLCEESMMPAPLTVLRHGTICEYVRFGFIAVAGLRNHVRTSSSALAAYFGSPV